MQKIVIDSQTREERNEAVGSDFPYRTDLCDLRTFPKSSYPWHWHNEVEFFFMEKGSLEYRVPGSGTVFGEGDAGFVNAGVMHLTEGLGSGECLQQEHIFLPKLLSGGASRIDSEYIFPLLNKGIPLVRFERGSAECGRAVSLMRTAFALFSEKPFGYEAEIRSCLTSLWILTLRLCRERGLGERHESADTLRIKKMAAFIEEHFSERLTLSLIAGAACIGERECCRCFSRQLRTSPMEYLIDVRVNKARGMLLSTDLKIERIAEDCGFSSGSYFTKVFRERTGLTPREFRA